MWTTQCTMTLELRSKFATLRKESVVLKSLHCLSAYHSVVQVWFDLVVLLLTR